MYKFIKDHGAKKKGEALKYLDPVTAGRYLKAGIIESEGNQVKGSKNKEVKKAPKNK